MGAQWARRPWNKKKTKCESKKKKTVGSAHFFQIHFLGAQDPGIPNLPSEPSDPYLNSKAEGQVKSKAG